MAFKYCNIAKLQLGKIATQKNSNKAKFERGLHLGKSISYELLRNVNGNVFHERKYKS